MNQQNNSSPLVTILIGTFKRPNLIYDSIESFLNQTYKDLIIIIFDDNHPDDEETVNKTKSEIDKFNDPRIKYIKNDTNIGVPFVYKKWISHVETKYFMMIGDGDRLLPNAIEKWVNFLENHPRSSMVHSQETNGSGTKDPQIFNESGEKDPIKYLEYHMIRGNTTYSWSQASALFRTEFWIVKNIPFSHDHYWDYYFHCAYILFSEKIGHINEHLSIREKSDIPYSEYVEKNFFKARVERIAQGLKFLDEYELYMLQKGYPISNYRLHLSKQLFRIAFILKSNEESLYCLKKSLYNIIQISLTNLFLKTIIKFKRKWFKLKGIKLN